MSLNKRFKSLLKSPITKKYIPYNGQNYTLSEIVNSFPKFVIYMFMFLRLPMPTEAQIVMAEHLNSQDKPDKMLLALRGLGKSLMAQLYVLWRLLRNNDEHILVISASSKRAKNFTGFVLSMMKSAPLLRHMYPRSDQRKASDHFDVNGSKPSDSPNMFAAGIGTGLAGFRATIIVSDDIEQPQNSRTPESRDILIHYFNEAINLLISDGKKQGEVIILGTYQTTDSIYLKIESGGYDVMIIPAEYPKLKHTYGKRLAPYIQERVEKDPSLAGMAVDSRFPMEVLNTRRLKIGKSAFNLQYNLDPTDSDETRFPLKLRDLILMDFSATDELPLKVMYSSINKVYSIKHSGFSTDFLTTPGFLSEERAKFDYIVMAIDPSGRGQDETGISIIGLLNGYMFLIDNTAVDNAFSESSFNTIESLAAVNKINTIIVESNFGDGSYTKMLQAHMPQYEIIETRAVSQKEVRIIETLEPIMNQHRLIVNTQILLRENDDTPTTNRLSYQLTHITRERGSLQHDDRLDSLEMAVSHLVEYLSVNQDKRLKQAQEGETPFSHLEAALGLPQGSLEGNTTKPLNYGASY